MVSSLPLCIHFDTPYMGNNPMVGATVAVAVAVAEAMK
jgi:hypothetical protein